MKISLVLRPRRPLSRAEAWGCLTANLVLPGAGSLVAGRAIGYAQIFLAVIGLAISAVETVFVAIWYFQNYQRLNTAADPIDTLIEIGKHFIGPVAGLTIFALAILWALITSIVILKGTPKQ